MKRLTPYILAAAVCVPASCYKDLSTEATFEIPPIEVSSEEYPGDLINISYGQVLEISVDAVQEDRNPEDFEFFWEVDMVAGKPSDRIELGTEPAVSYQVASTPSDAPYNLSVRVTDTRTGYAVYKVWKMYVTSSLGEGLLVAHTRDGGKTSELDLVAAQNITYGYTGAAPLYTRNLYSFANSGEVLEGRVNAVTAFVGSDGAVFNVNKIRVATDAHLLSIDPLTYQVEKTDAELFNLATETSFRTTAAFNFAAYQSGAIVNNSLYNVICNSDNKYSKVSFTDTPSNIFRPGNIAYGKLDQSVLAVFDEVHEKFYYIYGWQASMGSFTYLEANASFPLTGARSIAGGCFNSSTLGFVLQSADGKYHVCTIKQGNTSLSFADYDLDAPEIENAVSFAFCDNADLFYYATERSIYPVVISGGKAIVGAALTWAPDSSDEKITSIAQYIQGWLGTHQYYMESYDFPLPTNRTQVILTTYNEKTGEGKIYLRPFTASTGRFTTRDNGTFGGFGEITAIGSTLR